MSKLYFDENRDWCRTLEYWKDYMRNLNLSEMELWRAKPVFDVNLFHCKKGGFISDKALACGKHCNNYAPCNGKNGKCKHMGFTYEATDEKYILKNVLTGWKFRREVKE